MRTEAAARDPATGHGPGRDIGLPVAATPRRWWSHVTEPYFIFPAMAIVMLAVIWETTLGLVARERAAAERAAVVSTREMTGTYEAQVVRALQEIDKTLKVVKYAYERRGRQAVLKELEARALLPPELLFTVYIADRKGDIVASTRPSPVTKVADRDYFQSQTHADDLSIGLPRQRPGSEEWRLVFSRRLNASDGGFAGIAMVAVDASYFTSGYDSSKLGERGLLGVLGADGVFRVLRSGEKVSAGDKVDYAAVVLTADDTQPEVTLATNAWDGVRRYTGARQLYQFPLAVIVGLAEDEQLAAMRADRQVQLWRALAASFLVITVFAVLGHMGRQLRLTRLRAADEMVAHAARIEHLAYHDGLTTLPNRRLFSTLLERSITQARRYGRKLAVLFLDLDRFKNINDTLGHEAGDQLLTEVSTRLKGCVRESDTVARLGGDEFVVLMPELDDERAAADVARKILAAVARPLTLVGQDICITASVGICVYPRDGLDEQTLTMNADIAMYQAKREGKNTFQFHSEKLSANLLERFSLESDLREAIARGQLQLHYQAKRDIPTGRITGMEALLRWHHPTLGVVAPMRFIPVAEESGLIVPIGKWAIRTACAQNAAWQEQGLPRLSVAVNLTARQFADEQLLADLKAILAETGMDATLLELEITESMLMRDVAAALQTLSGLRDMGVRIAIDDFGISYSSLTTLRQFPLDSIKIDRSFIRDIVGVAEGRDLARAVIAMGRTLSHNIVAQGVETKEQAEFLRENACAEFQGFYLGKPVPAGQMADLLRQQSGVEATEPRAVPEA
jgi:diguanylate cyclase (GGDEF)-like protein